MISIRVLGLSALSLMVSACGGEDEEGTESGSFAVTSPAIQEGGMIPAENTCEGRPFPVALSNPAISWTPGPEGTQSYAIVVKHLAISDGLPQTDPNYFRGFMWAIWDIPANVTSIPANLGSEQFPTAIPGAQQWTSYNQFGYFAPCPNFDLEAYAASGTRVVDDYGFTVYAVGAPKLTLPPMPAGVTNYTMTLALHLDQVALAQSQLNAQSNAVPTMGPTPPTERPALVYPTGITATPAEAVAADPVMGDTAAASTAAPM